MSPVWHENVWHLCGIAVNLFLRHRCVMSRDDAHFRLRIPEDLRERVRMLATENKRSMTAEIVIALKDYCDRADRQAEGWELVPPERIVDEEQSIALRAASEWTGRPIEHLLFDAVRDFIAREEQASLEQTAVVEADIALSEAMSASERGGGPLPSVSEFKERHSNEVRASEANAHKPHAILSESDINRIRDAVSETVELQLSRLLEGK